MTLTETRYPKLRNVDSRPLVQNGQPYLLLRDPLQLTDKMLIVPQVLAPVLALCDGTRENASALSASLAVRFGFQLPPEVIEPLLAALDTALLLENATFRAAREQILAEYRQAPFRPPIHAGQSYPANAGELRRVLQGYLDAVDGSGDSLPIPAPALPEGSGLVSPHIDYARGGPVYARVWKRATEMVRAADLAILLGTDHYSEENLLTLTRQHYATPYGILPTARGIVDALAGTLGEASAFAGELHHRSEHSIELAAVWLHHIREGQPCEMVPVLCGSFRRFVGDGADPEADPAIRAFVETLKRVTGGRRVVVVAAGDLAHVGPAFGGDPVDFAGRARLQAADDELIAQMCAGDAAGFLGAIKQVNDRNNVCGLPPIYLALRMLGSVQGERVAYDRCPADEEATSLVSVGGVVFNSRAVYRP